MEQLAAVIVLVIGSIAFVLAPRHGVRLRWLLAATAVLSAIGAYVLFLAPRDYMVRFPWTATVFHPWLVALYGGAAFVVFCGVALGLLARFIYGFLATK